MTQSEAQQAASEFFADLKESEGGFFEAWSAWAKTKGAPVEAYFLATMWPWFVLPSGPSSMSVPYYSGYPSSDFREPTFGDYFLNEGSVTWQIYANWLAGLSYGWKAIAALGPASDGSLDWVDHTTGATDGNFFWEGELVPMLPNWTEVSVIVLPLNGFPLLPFNSPFQWHLVG